MLTRRRIGPRLRGPQFLLDDRAASQIEAFLNQARLVLVGCLLFLANARLLPGSGNQFLVALTVGGIAWVVVIALLTRYAYRPWIAIAFALGDTLFVSMVVYLTGGPTSPLDALYAILIFAAAIRLTRIHSFLLTLAVILAYAEVTWLHPSFVRAIHANALATRSVILAATGVLAWLIAAEVARQRQAIVDAEGRAASLILIDDVARTLAAAAEPDEVLRATASLTTELLSPLAVAVLSRTHGRRERVVVRGFAWPEQSESPPESDAGKDVQRAMQRHGCREIVEMPIGPPGHAGAWLYVGVRAPEALGTVDRAVLQRIAEEARNALQRTGLLQRERERAASLAAMAEENRRLLEGERETVARLRQLAVHKEGFIDLIAHELRTPLTSVKGFAQLLLRGGSSTAGRRYVEMILGESNRLVHIIDDIVDLSRMERGLLEMRRESVDLREVLKAVLAGLGPDEQKLRVELAAELPAVRGDPDKLRQAMVNLLAAGALYHESSDPMTLRVLAGEDRVVLIRLEVAGSIPEADLGQVFDHNPRDLASGPPSLSLYICKNFVEANGGDLRVDRSGSNGAHLLVSLPAAPENPRLRRVARGDSHGHGRTTAAPRAIVRRHPPQGKRPQS